jgi:hypothetical protein
MHSNSDVRCFGWSWNTDSVQTPHLIVFSVTLSIFYPHIEHLTLHLDVSSVTWNVSIVIWVLLVITLFKF